MAWVCTPHQTLTALDYWYCPYFPQATKTWPDVFFGVCHRSNTSCSGSEHCLLSISGPHVRTLYFRLFTGRHAAVSERARTATQQPLMRTPFTIRNCEACMRRASTPARSSTHIAAGYSNALTSTFALTPSHRQDSRMTRSQFAARSSTTTKPHYATASDVTET